mmetsp:Transcript_17687/g.50428  ORF Transcript_17687/g.50428 Transcript_17687/m.50428 type:complete len:259 (+) Transcript_17687:232-1008(+)
MYRARSSMESKRFSRFCCQTGGLRMLACKAAATESQSHVQPSSCSPVHCRERRDRSAAMRQALNCWRLMSFSGYLEMEIVSTSHSALNRMLSEHEVTKFPRASRTSLIQTIDEFRTPMTAALTSNMSSNELGICCPKDMWPEVSRWDDGEDAPMSASPSSPSSPSSPLACVWSRSCDSGVAFLRENRAFMRFPRGCFTGRCAPKWVLIFSRGDSCSAERPECSSSSRFRLPPEWPMPDLATPQLSLMTSTRRANVSRM